MSDESNSDYEVGYGRPPLHGRFQKGHTRGNRKGRRRGSVNLKTDLLQELAETVTLTENGKSRRMTKQRAMLKTLVVRGIKGDSRATAKIFDLVLRFIGTDNDTEPADALSPEDQAILDTFLARGGEDGNGE